MLHHGCGKPTSQVALEPTGIFRTHAAKSSRWAAHMNELTTLVAATLDYSTQSASAGQNPDTVAERYRILGELARGGMGVVYRAIDARFDRPLALKALLPGAAGNAHYEARFVNEARIHGQLQHPGVAPVHDVGRLPDGRLFFCMKLIEGQTLSALLSQRSSPQEDQFRFITIFEQVAQTIAYAHGQRIIHRDLKPLNVMVGAFGEVQVMDWGLAKKSPLADRPTVESPLSTKLPGNPTGKMTAGIDTDTSTAAELTYEGDHLGTPAYMSPEQARGETSRLDARCDVFGLGAVLCEILTGNPPFQAQDSQAAIEMARRCELDVAFAKLESSIADSELIDLAKSCLASHPDARPAHAGQVAERISRHLASVQERLHRAELRRTAAEAKAAEERKRRRVSLALAAALAVMIASGAAFLIWNSQREADIAQRDELTIREIQEALLGAEGKLDELARRLAEPASASQLVNDNGVEWQERLAAVDAELKRAGSLIVQIESAPTRELAERLAALIASYRRHAAGRELSLALEQDRSLGPLGGGDFPNSGDDPSLGPQASPARFVLSQQRNISREFWRHFELAGIHVGTGGSDQAARTIADSPVKHLLLAALDHWAVLTPDPQERIDVLALARAADPHPLRDRMRNPVAWGDRLALPDLIAEAANAAEDVPASLVSVLLSQAVSMGVNRHLLGELPRERASDDFWLLVSLGDVQSEPEAQIGYFRAALALRPASALPHFNIGLARGRQGRFDDARMEMERALELFPLFLNARNGLGNVELERGNPAAALAEFTRAKDTFLGQGNEIHSDIYYGLGRAHSDLGEWESAEAAYHKVLEVEPRDAYALNNLGQAREAQGDVLDALGWYRQATLADADFAGARYNLGRMYGLLAIATSDGGDERTGHSLLLHAEEHLRSAVLLDPANAPSHTNLGLVLRMLGNLKESLELQRKSVALAPEFGLAHYNLALTLLAAEQEEEASERLRRAWQLQPDLIEHYIYQAGMLLVQQGELDKALQHGKRALELLRPEHEQARQLVEDFIAHCQRLIEMKPPDDPGATKLN